MIGTFVDGLSTQQKIAIHTNPADIKEDIKDNTDKQDTLNFDGLLFKILRMLPDYAILDGVNIQGENSKTINDYLFNNNWYYALNEACNLMNIYGDAVIIIGNEEIMKTFEEGEGSIVDAMKAKMLTKFDVSQYTTKKPVRPVVVTNNFAQVLVTKIQGSNELDDTMLNEDGEELAYTKITIKTFDKIQDKFQDVDIHIHPSRVLYFRYDTLLSGDSNSNTKKSTTSLYHQIYTSYAKYNSLLIECVKAVNKSNTTIVTMDKDYLESSSGATIADKLKNQYNNLERQDKEGGIVLQLQSIENNANGSPIKSDLITFNRLPSNYTGLGDLVEIATKNLCANVNIPQSILMSNQATGGLQTSTNEKDAFNQAVETYARKHIQKPLDIVLQYLKESNPLLIKDEILWNFKEGIEYTTQEQEFIKQTKATTLKEVVTTIALARENNILQNISIETQKSIEDAIMEILK